MTKIKVSYASADKISEQRSKIEEILLAFAADYRPFDPDPYQKSKALDDIMEVFHD